MPASMPCTRWGGRTRGSSGIEPGSCCSCRRTWRATTPTFDTIVRDGFGRLARFVAEASGAPAADVRRFFETGMLMNVVAAMELDRVRQPWARDLMVPMEDRR